MGDQSQTLVADELENGAGVGAIISPRDLTLEAASRAAATFRGFSASVLYDPQFHVPGFSNSNLESYPTDELRATVSSLNEIDHAGLDHLRHCLEQENSRLDTDAVIAPAVVYEAGRSDVISLNSKLHAAAKAVADAVGKPCYATVFLGNSVTSSLGTILSVLSSATNLECDGWYFGFEFPPERIPSDQASVLRCLVAGLSLATTGKPVLHAYAGPMAILSTAFGATGAALGHRQNLWRFSRERWEAVVSTPRRSSPPRFFSTALWGTVIYPDETYNLSQDLQDQILQPSPFTRNLNPVTWKKGDASRHLVYAIASKVEEIAVQTTPRECAASALLVLDNAIALHGQLAAEMLTLADQANAYQQSWRSAVQQLLDEQGDDLDYLELLG